MMVRASFLAALALLLSGCGQEAADGYAFDSKEYALPRSQIDLVEHASLASLRTAMPPTAVGTGREVMAWSRLNGGRCEIHVLDPDIHYQPEWIGHEVAHCFYGQWHD